MIELAPGSDVSILEANAAARSHPIIRLRAGAVNGYANLEQSLARIFAHCLGTDRSRGNIVFYRIVNTRSRNAIITKLMRKQFADRYSVFWNSSLKLIRELDDSRNKIIHWHLIVEIKNKDGRNTADVILCPPGTFDETEPEDRQPLTEFDLEEFNWKADFMSQLLLFFAMHQDRSLPAPWPDIFEKAVTYPPDQAHPLGHLQRKRDNPPQS